MLEIILIFKGSERIIEKKIDTGEKVIEKPRKQKCIVCKRFVVHSERKFLICLDCLIMKLIQIDKTGELFQLLKESAKE